MMQADKRPGARPLRRQVVHGEPTQLLGWTVTPVARVTSYARGRGTLRRASLSGWAAGMVRVVPLGVIAEAGGQKEWIPVRDVTAAAVGRLVLAAAAATLFLTAVRQLVRRRQQAAS